MSPPGLSQARGPDDEAGGEAAQAGDDEGDGDGGELGPGLALARPPLRHGREQFGPVRAVTRNIVSLSLSSLVWRIGPMYTRYISYMI